MYRLKATLPPKNLRSYLRRWKHIREIFWCLANVLVKECHKSVTVLLVLRYGFSVSVKMPSFCLEHEKQTGLVELILSQFLFYKVSLVGSSYLHFNTTNRPPLYISFWCQSLLFTDSLQAIWLSIDPLTLLAPSFNYFYIFQVCLYF